MCNICSISFPQHILKYAIHQEIDTAGTYEDKDCDAPRTSLLFTAMFLCFVVVFIYKRNSH